MASNSLYVPIRGSWHVPPLPPEVWFPESYSSSEVWRQACCLNNGDSVTQLAREKSNKGEAAVWQAWASCLRTPPVMKAGKGKVAEFVGSLLLSCLPLIWFSYKISQQSVTSGSVTPPHRESLRSTACHRELSPRFSFQHQHLESQLLKVKLSSKNLNDPEGCNIWTRNWEATFSCSN